MFLTSFFLRGSYWGFQLLAAAFLTGEFMHICMPLFVCRQSALKVPLWITAFFCPRGFYLVFQFSGFFSLFLASSSHAHVYRFVSSLTRLMHSADASLTFLALKTENDSLRSLPQSERTRIEVFGTRLIRYVGVFDASIIDVLGLGWLVRGFPIKEVKIRCFF
jgi:hypothetical protein